METKGYAKTKAKLEEQEKFMNTRTEIWKAISTCITTNCPHEAKEWLEFYDNINGRIEE